MNLPLRFGASHKNSISDQTKNTKAEIDLCLKHQHPKFKNAAATLEEFKYAKEDWADFIGQMAEEKDAMGYECLFLKDAYDIGEKLSLENEGSTDTHASDFFRGLSRYNFRHGSLPPSCIAALKEKGEEPNFRDCRPKVK